MGKLQCWFLWIKRKAALWLSEDIKTHSIYYLLFIVKISHQIKWLFLVWYFVSVSDCATQAKERSQHWHKCEIHSKGHCSVQSRSEGGSIVWIFPPFPHAETPQWAHRDWFMLWREVHLLHQICSSQHSHLDLYPYGSGSRFPQLSPSYELERVQNQT